MSTNTYMLCHKDIPVAEIELPYFRLKKIYNEEHLPIKVSQYPQIAERQLQNWDDARSIPTQRQNIDRIIKKIGCSVSDAKLKSMRVSLTDCYWFKEKKSNLKWGDVNYHDNGFSNDFFNTTILNDGIKVVKFNSPDYTTDGALKKGWLIIDSVPELIKFGDFGVNANGKNLLSANEVIACKVASLMGIEHVLYEPVKIEETGEIACQCECFIKDNEHEFVSAYQTGLRGMTLYTYFSEIGLREEVDKMLLLDFILHNTDRHEKNLGYIRNPDTLSIISFAPIFDSGSCLGWNYNEHIRDTGESKPFINNRMEQLDLCLKVKCEVPSSQCIKSIIYDIYQQFEISELNYKIACNDIDKTFQLYSEVNRNSQVMISENEKEVP